MKVDYKKFLKNLELFKELSDPDLDKVLDFCHEGTFDTHDVIFQEGDAADRFYIILSGRVEVWKDYATPYADILAIKGEGASFGEMALIDDRPRSATIKVAEPVRVLYQNKADFQRILHENVSIAMVIMKSVSNMVRQSNESFIYGLRQKNQKLELAYEELKKAQQELLRNERLSTMGKFSSMILHDLRNPISIIKGYAEMVLLNSANPERTEMFIGKLIGEADRLNRLAGELLDYSRGDIRLNLGPIFIGDFFKKIEESIQTQLRSKNIDLEIQNDTTDPILMDVDRMQRVFGNLIDNSRKAMGRGGHLILKAVPENGLVHLSVIDDGEGMTAEVREKMFDPFFSSSSAGGTGLGMLVVANVIEAHHGSIKVDSEPGKGTAIRISLPTTFGP